MKVIVAGSRSVDDYRLVKLAIEMMGLEITEIVSGTARGVDSLAEVWANKQKPPIPVKPFPADWNDVEGKPKHLVRKGRYGKYYLLAGFERNEKMAKYADALIAIWDGESGGTKDMIDRANNHGLKVFIAHSDVYRKMLEINKR